MEICGRDGRVLAARGEPKNGMKRTTRLADPPLDKESPIQAVCGKAARTVLCGGRSAMSVPTAIALIYLIAGGTFVAGALVAYAWYLFVHHCAHHGPDKLPLPLLKHHQSHHRFATRNYGVSTALWDHVFGTMLR